MNEWSCNSTSLHALVTCKGINSIYNHDLTQLELQTSAYPVLTFKQPSIFRTTTKVNTTVHFKKLCEVLTMMLVRKEWVTPHWHVNFPRNLRDLRWILSSLISVSSGATVHWFQSQSPGCAADRNVIEWLAAERVGSELGQVNRHIWWWDLWWLLWVVSDVFSRGCEYIADRNVNWNRYTGINGARRTGVRSQQLRIRGGCNQWRFNWYNCVKTRQFLDQHICHQLKAHRINSGQKDRICQSFRVL